MLKKMICLFALVILLTNSVGFASSSDRWQWIVSDDKQGVFFDTESIQFGTKEKCTTHNHKYEFYKVADVSKIIVCFKTFYTEAGCAPYVESARMHGNYEAGEALSNMEYTIQKMEFDYTKDSYRIGWVAIYDADGNIIDIIPHTGNEPWIEIIPASKMEKIAKFMRSYAMKNYDKVKRQTNTLD